MNDYNRDGQLDVFVVCHGWDKRPYPGERNKIVLSQPDGSYAIRDAANDVGFFHSGASADFNGDGNPDVIVTNNFDERPVRVWLGDGKGGFRVTTKTVPSELKKRGDFFTVELPDVDGDGRFDLFVGGHEFGNSAPTKVFLNKAKRGFRAGKSITVPAVKGEGVVLDAVATGVASGRQLWVLRTSGGDGSFYKGYCIQAFDLETSTSRISRCNKIL
ncbi:FG-GAP repeat domain-containing protein [Ruegeria sp. SCP11]|uniref:FG-GAP repeat domain-containing protein n=1 Tax=Ruegeria sp. SCP11 TaxID=3141378 RepID=UPI00333C9777